MRVLLIEDDSATAQGIELMLKTEGFNVYKVRGLGTGADDYMTKPFHKDELIARIHAVVRRSKGHSQSIITTGDIKYIETVWGRGYVLRDPAKDKMSA